MNESARVKTEAHGENSTEARVREWIASEDGHLTLCRVLDGARETTSRLARDCQVERGSLHEPVTV